MVSLRVLSSSAGLTKRAPIEAAYNLKLCSVGFTYLDEQRFNLPNAIIFMLNSHEQGAPVCSPQTYVNPTKMCVHFIFSQFLRIPISMNPLLWLLFLRGKQM